MCNLWEVAIIWRERKWSAFGLLLSYMDLVADRYNSFVNAHFWGDWEIYIFSWWLPSIYFHLDKVMFIARKRSFLNLVCTPFPLHRVFKDIAVLVHQVNLHTALLDFRPKPSDALQGWMTGFVNEQYRTIVDMVRIWTWPLLRLPPILIPFDLK